MVGRSKAKRPKNKNKPCGQCQGPMPVRDGHADCLECLGLDHAVLAANAAGNCGVCGSLPEGLRASRLRRLREITAAYEAEDERAAEEQQDAQPAEDEDPPQEEEPEPAGARAARRNTPSRAPPDQEAEEEEEEQEYEPEGEHYGDDDDGGYEAAYYSDGQEGEEVLEREWPPEVLAGIRAALQYERDGRAGAQAQAADPAPAAAAAEAAPPPLRRELPQLECDERDPVALFKAVADSCGVQWPVSAAPKAMLKSSFFMAFGATKEPQRERLVLPIMPDFAQFLETSWEKPAESKAITPLLCEFATAGAKEAGLKTMPVMDRNVAEHLTGKTVPRNKEPGFDGLQEQTVTRLIRSAYACVGSAAEASNALAMLQYASFSLMHDMGEDPTKMTKAQILLLHRLHRETMAFTTHVVASSGRALAQLVQLERSRWLALSTEKDKEAALDQAVKPDRLFAESVPEMVVRHQDRKKTQEALNALWPTAPPKSSFSFAGKKPAYTAFRGGKTWSQNRFGAPRAGSSGPPKPRPPAEQQQERGGKRPAKRPLQRPDSSPAARGRGRGRGSRGSSADRSAK